MTPDPPALMAENRLYRLLADLPPAWPGRPVVLTARVPGVAAVLHLGPPGSLPVPAADGRPLSAREREALQAVRAEVARLGRRVLGREVRAALAAGGYRWSAGTINSALAELVGKGVLINDNDKTGYGLTPGGPMS